MVISCIDDFMGPMHKEKIMGNTQKIPIASLWFSFLKVGISP